MSPRKPRGKHAQGAHAAPANIASEPPKSPRADLGESVEEIEAATERLAGDAPDAPDAPSQPIAEDAATVAMAPVAPAFDMPALSPQDPGYSATADGAALKKRHRVGKVLGITFGSIFGILLVVYIAGVVLFMGRFYPHTTIVGQDVSMMTNEEVAQVLQDQVDGYSINVVGNGYTYKADSADLGLSIDADAVIEAMHADLNSWAWPKFIFQESHDETSQLTVSYKKNLYDKDVIDTVSEFNKDAIAPVDATIVYEEKTKSFTVEPEVPGTQYDSKRVLDAMDEAIAALDPNVKLTGEHLVQPKVFSDDERLIESAQLATGMVSSDVKLTLNGQPATEITGEQLSGFVKVKDDLGVEFDDAGFEQWVTDLCNSFDTVGSERTYTRADGKVITVKGGAYGWVTNSGELKEQVVAAIKAGEDTTIDIPCRETAAVYNGAGQRDWGNRYVDVDISEQYVRFYGDDGSIIWECDCITGAPDGKHNTWPGVWYVTNKESPSKLIGYTESGEKDYETTVQYWMAFEGNGIGLHDATWQPSFGGSMYANGYGSHGCVNLPYSAAESLYGIIQVGDVVVVHS